MMLLHLSEFRPVAGCLITCVCVWWVNGGGGGLFLFFLSVFPFFPTGAAELLRSRCCKVAVVDSWVFKLCCAIQRGCSRPVNRPTLMLAVVWGCRIVIVSCEPLLILAETIIIIHTAWCSSYWLRLSYIQRGVVHTGWDYHTCIQYGVVYTGWDYHTIQRGVV